MKTDSHCHRVRCTHSSRSATPLLLAVAALSGLSCEPPELPTPTEPFEAPAQPPAFPDSPATDIDFIGSSARLNLTAGVPAQVQVQVLPAGQYSVRFSVAGGDEPFNVFLSDDQVDTDDTGLAAVTVHARGVNTNTPQLIAAVGRLSSAPLFLSVGASTNATLSVRALEPVGSVRQVEQWVLSAHLDSDCSQLAGTPPPDGELLTTADYSGPEQQVVLRNVPSGRTMAIVLRAGQFAGGCKNLRPLNPNSQYLTDLEVNLRPLHFEDTSLSLEFGLDDATEFDGLYSDYAFRIADTLSTLGPDDLAVVFDSMSARADDPTAFEQARTDNDWRTAWLLDQGAELAGAGIRDLVRRWLQSGLSPLTDPTAFEGVVVSSENPEDLSFSLLEVAQLPPADVGFSSAVGVSMLADANDFLRLTVPMLWQPSPYLQNAAQALATTEFPQSTTVPGALAEAFDCTAMGEVLVEAASPPSPFAFGQCNADCIEDLCRDAMVALWDTMASTALPSVQWVFTATAQAVVDNWARPQQAEGGSLHTLTTGEQSLNAAGTFRATALDAPPPELSNAQ